MGVKEGENSKKGILKTEIKKNEPTWEKEKVRMEIRKGSKERISIPREGEGRNGNT